MSLSVSLLLALLRKIIVSISEVGRRSFSCSIKEFKLSISVVCPLSYMLRNSRYASSRLLIEGTSAQIPQAEQTIINLPLCTLLTSIELGRLHFGHLYRDTLSI